MNQQLITKKAIQKANLVEQWLLTKGHVTKMCKTVGINRETFYNWLKKDKEFNKNIRTAESSLNDDVRNALLKNIKKGTSTDIQFYLKKRHPDFKDVSQVQINQQLNIGKVYVKLPERK